MTGRKSRLILWFFLALFVVGGTGIAAEHQDGATAKYVFLFIGDGMGVAQRNAAELFLGKKRGAGRPEETRLVMNTLPAQGLNTNSSLSSVITDSAAASTAIACGHKTRYAVIGMDEEAKSRYESIAELAKKQHRKIGILTTVSLDHATPAAFYAHVPRRSRMYEISMQLANSGFDYFAGGQLRAPTDKENPSKPDAVEAAKKNGYRVAVGREEFEALEPGEGKVLAMSGVVDKDAAMYFTLDQGGDRAHVTIAEYLAKAVELLDNPDGFFIMTEGGKIDWACHAHDAAAVIHDVLALDDAVAVAVRFYEKHPRETLIVVTGDHETGGLAIGYSGTGYTSHIEKIQHQKSSYIEFGKKLAEYKKSRAPGDARLEDLLPLIRESFGLYVMPADEKHALEKTVTEGSGKDASDEARAASTNAREKLKYGMALTDLELNSLREAFERSKRGEEELVEDDVAFLLYGGEEPLVASLTTILDNKAGLSWATYAHTGIPIQTSALGVGAEKFDGYYDQTAIFSKMVEAAGLNAAQ